MSRWRAAARALLLLSLPCFAGCTGGETDPTTPGVPGGGSGAAARVERVEIVSEPAASGTYLAGEELAFAVWLTSGEAVEVSGDVFLIFDLGLAREPAALTDATGDWLEFRYRLRRGDYDGDGVSVPAGELMLSAGASLRVGGQSLDPSVPELAPLPEHRVFARYAAGETLVFDRTLDGFPPGADPLDLDALGLPGAVGCASPDDLVPIVESVLEGNLPAAGNLWSAAFGTGRCAVLTAGEPAIFLSAAVFDHRGLPYDLALAYGPGEIPGGGIAFGNWWTLADFLAEPGPP